MRILGNRGRPKREGKASAAVAAASGAGAGTAEVHAGRSRGGEGQESAPQEQPGQAGLDSPAPLGLVALASAGRGAELPSSPCSEPAASSRAWSPAAPSAGSGAPSLPWGWSAPVRAETQAPGERRQRDEEEEGHEEEEEEEKEEEEEEEDQEEEEAAAAPAGQTQAECPPQQGMVCSPLGSPGPALLFSQAARSQGHSEGTQGHNCSVGGSMARGNKENRAKEPLESKAPPSASTGGTAQSPPGLHGPGRHSPLPLRPREEEGGWDCCHRVPRQKSRSGGVGCSPPQPDCEPRGPNHQRTPGSPEDHLPMRTGTGARVATK
ncbi:hypothetical protein P7K49_025932 [Saguinus oedipus]|uniref:Uncharacterized protein n=1 Tax=Saguinus oedipus TaxID=9490 RepID=A0ABQ9UIL4_SAGOE|nr:hypothetical protein P7K49_025932 [Saguinus oedipus]